MARLKGAFQADNGDELYPHTSSDCVFGPDGKTVEEQINDLSTERGYKDIKPLLNQDANNAIENGKYSVYLGVNCPNEQEHYTIDVTKWSERDIVQIATCLWSSSTSNVGKIYKRIKAANVWKDWEAIATTSKTDISFPFNSGFSQRQNWGNRVVKDALNKVTIDIGVTGSISNFESVIGVLPVGYIPRTRTQVPIAVWGVSSNMTMGYCVVSGLNEANKGEVRVACSSGSASAFSVNMEFYV